ncbi:3-deoxy-D-manno-octulosonic acid transferase [Poseidonocella sp. HB161398]|uniref:3-deoxy-D-manno-octulosonic acid transferase n=1 Tax=Poseidonocella sp. HB161398 TaxID=2320855 RepID=UPI0011092AA9|nr:3-deoxy-D-manno-octulosonic acid transferase [Poseidonocella sp. HB161398]
MKPLALSAYLAFSRNAEGWGRRQLQKRLARGKEDPARIGEREGRASQPRPEGPLIWFHAASVGESLSILEVVKRLGMHDPQLNFLVTTGTVTSAEILAARLPPRSIHQFVPLDVLPFVRRFLAHWQPDLAIWTESEFWPALITETAARGTPLLLLNARMSERSARRWYSIGKSAKALLELFSAVQVQDDATAGHLRALGMPRDRMAVTGTLKEGTPPPPCDESELARLGDRLKGRPLWCAASTHEGEEEIAAQAHRLAQKSTHRLLMILAPRHPERGGAIRDMLAAQGFAVRLRSEYPCPDEDCEIYVADTLGEMGLWYRLAPVSFVGGSLVRVGGHNPYEPAALGSAILHGPHVHNFADIYARLDAAAAALRIADAQGLGEAVAELLQPSRSAPMAYAAWELSSSGADVTDKALALILEHLPGPAH